MILFRVSSEIMKAARGEGERRRIRASGYASQRRGAQLCHVSGEANKCDERNGCVDPKLNVQRSTRATAARGARWF